VQTGLEAESGVGTSNNYGLAYEICPGKGWDRCSLLPKEVARGFLHVWSDDYGLWVVGWLAEGKSLVV